MLGTAWPGAYKNFSTRILDTSGVQSINRLSEKKRADSELTEAGSGPGSVDARLGAGTHWRLGLPYPTLEQNNTTPESRNAEAQAGALCTVQHNGRVGGGLRPSILHTMSHILVHGLVTLGSTHTQVSRCPPYYQGHCQ